MMLMRQYQSQTNFQNPSAIAAFQALSFCPPINQSGQNWKRLNYENPQQRMTQLIKQQQYIQQMANQTAIAMAYFLEQQQKLQRQKLELERQTQSNSNLLNHNHSEPKNNQNGQHQHAVASVSSILGMDNGNGNGNG